jgi:hypothetical protein
MKNTAIIGAFSLLTAGLLAGCGTQSAHGPDPLLTAHHAVNDNQYRGGIAAARVLRPTGLASPAIPAAAAQALPEYAAVGTSTNLPDFSRSPSGAQKKTNAAVRGEMFGAAKDPVPWYYAGTTTRNNPMLLMADTVHNLAYPSRFAKVSRDVLKGAGTTFNSSNPTTVDQELHGSIAEQDPGFQTLYIPTLFTETMGIRGFQQTDPHDISIVSVGTEYVVPTYSSQKRDAEPYTVFHTYTPGQNKAPAVSLPAGYTLQNGPGTILVGQPVSDIVFQDAGQWAVGQIQWTFIEAYTNKGWYVVFLTVNAAPQHMGQTLAPSSNEVAARLLP